MPQVAPQLSYPGGCSAFFTDLHLDFSRWLRLVALVPLVHASIEGIYYEELCSHLLDILPSSNPSNVLAVSVERIRSSVSEMLFKEPFFVCPFSDSKSLLSTSRWIYDPSFDSEPSRISFAFRILLCVNLYPNWSVYDLLSRVACVMRPQTLSLTAPNVLETCRQRDPSGNHVSGTWSPRSTHVRVPISLLIGISVSPTRVGQDPPDQLEPSFSSDSEPTINSGPLRLPHSLCFRPEVSLDAIGSKLSGENSDFGTNQVPRYLSAPYEAPSRSPGSSVVHSHSVGADSADSQQYKGASDLPVLLGQLPSFSSASCCDISDSSCAKIPLFLPSQTPNRDLSPRVTFPTKAYSLQNELTSPLSASPQHFRAAVSHNDHLHTGPLCTSALQNVDVNNLEEAISLHDSRSLHATKFTIPKPTTSPWSNELGSDDCPRTPTQINHWPQRYQSAERLCSLGKRDRPGSGRVTNKTESLTNVLHAQGDSGPGETPLSKRTKYIAAPVCATAQDMSFCAPPADMTLTSSPLPPPDFGELGGSSYAEVTHPSKSSTTSKDDTVVPERGCTLIAPSPNAPHPDLGQNPPVSGACRPSVIVYKVARGPNLARSKDVVRISYGEGHQKRTRMKLSGHRNKTMHLDKKLADTKTPNKYLPAERIEGDMAWDFGVRSEVGERGANVHRPQTVRWVPGLFHQVRRRRFTRKAIRGVPFLNSIDGFRIMQLQSCSPYIASS
ncbi:hypothetical protein EDB86DRAFT_3078628 [Lactarius hatsudake]|nr:hypothetical protein EDB86DRAFT_3078628 [Lactarius hatsudake]